MMDEMEMHCPISEEDLAKFDASAVRLKRPGIWLMFFPSLDAAAQYASSPGGAERAFIALNTEKIVRLYKEPELFAGVRNPVFYPDGAPMLLFSPNKTPRIPGVELWLEVLKHQDRQNGTVLVIGAEPDVIEKSQARLQNMFPNISLTCIDGFQKEEIYLEHLDRVKPNAVFVAMGSPRQELQISRFQARHPSAFYMGIGGSLDILSEKKKRAPKFFLDNNIEFLHRLIIEPMRARRILKTHPKFLLYYLFGAYGPAAVVTTETGETLG